MSTEWKVGDHIRGLRMSNKAVSFTGVIQQLNADSKTVIVKVDGSPNWIEDVHVNDLAPAETPAQDAADLRAEGIAATATAAGIEVQVPAPEKNFVFVNGKPIA